MIHLFWAGILCVLVACVCGTFRPVRMRKNDTYEAMCGVFGMACLLLAAINWVVSVVPGWFS